MMNSVKDFKISSIGTKTMTDADRPMCVDSKGNDAVDWEAFDKMREEHPICIDHEAEMISFKVMTKPASEGGKGCQLTDLVEVALHMLNKLNVNHGCTENYHTAIALQDALKWQKTRTPTNNSDNFG